MSNDRMAGIWEQIQNKLSAHWGKLTVEDLRFVHGPGESGAKTHLADCEPEALPPDRLALARSGS